MTTDATIETPANDDFADDLLIGAEAIANYMKATIRRVYHLAETSNMPFSYTGSQLSLRKSSLRKYYERQEEARMARKPGK